MHDLWIDGAFRPFSESYPLPVTKNYLRTHFHDQLWRKMYYLKLFCQIQPNSPMFKEKVPKKDLVENVLVSKTHPYGRYILVPSKCFVRPQSLISNFQNIRINGRFKTKIDPINPIFFLSAFSEAFLLKQLHRKLLNITTDLHKGIFICMQSRSRGFTFFASVVSILALFLFFISAHELFIIIFPLVYCRTILLKLASLCVYIVVLNSEVKCIRNPPSASKCKKVYLALFLFKLCDVLEKHLQIWLGPAKRI